MTQFVNIFLGLKKKYKKYGIAIKWQPGKKNFFDRQLWKEQISNVTGNLAQMIV